MLSGAYRTLATVLTSEPKLAASFLAGHASNAGGYPKASFNENVVRELDFSEAKSYANNSSHIMQALGALSGDVSAQDALNAVSGTAWRFSRYRDGWTAAYGFRDEKSRFGVEYRGGTRPNERRFEIRQGFRDADGSHDVSRLTLFRQIYGPTVFANGSVLILPTEEACAILGIVAGDLKALASRLSEIIFSKNFEGRLTPENIEEADGTYRLRSRERFFPEEEKFNFIEPRSGARLERWVDVMVDAERTRIAFFAPPRLTGAFAQPKYEPLRLEGDLAKIETALRKRFP